MMTVRELIAHLELLPGDAPVAVWALSDDPFIAGFQDAVKVTEEPDGSVTISGDDTGMR